MSTAQETVDKVEKTSKFALPGTEVKLSCGKATVYPMGVRHVRMFNEKIMKAISTAAQYTMVRKGASDNEVGQAVMASMLPIIMTDLMDLVMACTTLPDEVEFDDLPHYDLPKVAEIWLEESFGTEEKRNPWIKAVERAIHCFTGKKTSISGMVSSFSSRRATQDETSSTTNNPDGPTEDGA